MTIPHQINTKVAGKLLIKGKHATQIRGVAMRVKDGGGGDGVFQVDGHNLLAPAGGQLQHLHGVWWETGELRHHQPLGVLVVAHSVGGGSWGVEGKLGGEVGGDGSHVAGEGMGGGKGEKAVKLP